MQRYYTDQLNTRVLANDKLPPKQPYTHNISKARLIENGIDKNIKEQPNTLRCNFRINQCSDYKKLGTP